MSLEHQTPEEEHMHPQEIIDREEKTRIAKEKALEEIRNGTGPDNRSVDVNPKTMLDAKRADDKHHENLGSDY